MSTFGKGRALMLGSYVSASAQSTPTPEAERFFRGVLLWAGVQFPVSVTGAPLEVRYTESGKDTLLFVFNHGKTAANGEVAVARPKGSYTAIDLLTGSRVPVTRSSSGLSVGVQLPPSGVQVLRLTADAVERP
jgi:hypothetical protein